jgi:hypothetical protein
LHGCMDFHELSTPTDAHKCVKVYYTHHIPSTCFSPSGGQLQRGVLSTYVVFAS